MEKAPYTCSRYDPVMGYMGIFMFLTPPVTVQACERSAEMNHCWKTGVAFCFSSSHERGVGVGCLPVFEE